MQPTQLRDNSTGAETIIAPRERSTIRVVATDWDLGELEPAQRILKPAGFQLEVHHCATADEVTAVAQGADALLVRSAPVTREAFAALSSVRFICRLGIGPWLVDLDGANEAKIAVADCPKYCTDEAVEHTLALILAANRHLLPAREAGRRGVWASYGDHAPVRPLASLTLGVVGLGRVGRRVAAVATTLGMDVIGHDPYTFGAPEGCELVDRETLLRESDIVCLLCPATDETHHFINPDSLALMREHSYVVNTGRGQLIDEGALLAALDAGHLAGAALDVLEQEPPPLDHPLLNRDDVLVTPHVGFISDESTHELKVHGARNVLHYFTGERVSSLLTPDFRRV